MINKFTFPLILIYTSSTFSTVEETIQSPILELEIEHEVQHQIIEKREHKLYTDKIYNNLTDSNGLMEILLEINTKLDNQEAEDIGPKALLFNYLVEEALQINKQDIEIILAENSSTEKLDLVKEFKDEIDECYNRARSFIDLYNRIVYRYSDEDIPEWVYEEFIESDSLMTKILQSLYLPLIDCFYQLKLLKFDDIINTLKNRSLEIFDNLNNNLAQVHLPSRNNIASIILSNINKNTPIDYEEISALIAHQTQSMGLENLPNFNILIRHLNNLKNFMDTIIEVDPDNYID